MDSGGQQSTTSSQTSPPSWELPQLKYGADQAMKQYQNPGPSYYPGTTVANLSPTTNAGIQAATGIGLNGNSATNAGTSYLQSVLGGAFMPQVGAALPPGSPSPTGAQTGTYLGNDNPTGGNPLYQGKGNQPISGGQAPAGGGQAGGQPGIGGNPYTDALNQSIFASVIPQVNAQFSAGGRYGSPDQSGTLGTAITNAIAPQVYQNYQNERGLQQQAAGLAPTYAQTQMNQVAGMQNAGQIQDTQAQNLVNADVNHFNYNQQLPQNKLNQLLQQLGMLNAGTQSTSTQSQPGGGIGGFLGGVAGGLLNGVI